MKTKEVTILKQDHFGKGMVRIDDKLIFIENALPNEKCEIEITEEKKKFNIGIIKKIIEESNCRVTPNCPYYDICGGCHIMHEDRNYQSNFKEDKVKELLERFAGLKDIKINSIVYENEFNYRNKIVLHGENNKLGFYKEKTHELVEIDECIITSKEINDHLKNIKSYLIDHKEVKIEKLLIRDTSKKEIMLVVEGKINIDNFISIFKEVTSIYINNKLVHGKKYLTEEMFDLTFKIYPDSFFQINYKTTLALYKKVQDFYKNKNYSKVLDLYCGTGTIGMIVSKYIDNVVGVEVVESAIKSALESALDNKIDNITFKCGKVEDMIDSFKDIDSIIVDPPRKGLDNHTIKTILDINPETIVYISCDPVTLARDLKELSSKYEVLEVNLFDMFPNTYHVETVVFLERKRLFNNYDIIINNNNLYKEQDFKNQNFIETTDILGEKIKVEEETYKHFLLFKEKLKEYGLEVSITSGYRSLEDQREIVEELKTVYKNEDILFQKTARVGTSEHHTGLALDITFSNKEQFKSRLTKYYTEEEIEEREKKYKLMADLCSDFGFILRYPKGKEDITGFSYEPWHFRYVGERLAKFLTKENLTLEEYKNNDKL